MEIKSVTFNFENCESLTVLGRYIDYISFTGITRDLFWGKNLEDTVDVRNCKRCHMNISPEGNGIYNEEYSVFTRLGDFRDIENITVNYYDDTSETFFVPWATDNDRYGNTEFINPYQESFVDRCGLNILIEEH